VSHKYCCPVLELVVQRGARQGIRWGLMVNFKTGKSRDELIIEFPKSKDRKAAHANSTYAPLSFCPFCGVKQEYEARQKRRGSKAAQPTEAP
jgi:hypothetical protein